LAVVQSANPIAVESLLIDFQARGRKELGRKFFDREPDRIRRARKPSIPHGLALPSSIPPGEQLRIAFGGEELRHDVVVKRHAAACLVMVFFALMTLTTSTRAEAWTRKDTSTPGARRWAETGVLLEACRWQLALSMGNGDFGTSPFF
jgi:hypothetical protein